MTSDKIISAARELFEEKGFDLTSVREIAAKAGVNVALINYHFGSKENLLLAIMEKGGDATRLKLNDINNSSASSEEKLSLVIDMYVEKIFVNCQYHHFIHRELSTSQRPELIEGITKLITRNSQEVRKIMEEGQKKKTFRKDADLEMAMGTIFGLIYQTTHTILKKRYIRPHESEEAYKARIKSYLMEVLIDYLAKK